MNKKIAAGVSTIILCSSIFTVAAATNGNNPIRTAIQSLCWQIQAQDTAKDKEELINQPQAREIHKSKSAPRNTKLTELKINKEDKLTNNKDNKLKAEIDVRTKISNDRKLDDLLKNVQIYSSDLGMIQQNYGNNKALVSSIEFKSLENKIIANAKAIIDRYQVDGSITKKEAQSEKMNIESISAGINNNQENVDQLFRGGMYRGGGRNFDSQRGSSSDRGYRYDGRY